MSSSCASWSHNVLYTKCHLSELMNVEQHLFLSFVLTCYQNTVGGVELQRFALKTGTHIGAGWSNEQGLKKRSSFKTWKGLLSERSIRASWSVLLLNNFTSCTKGTYEFAATQLPIVLAWRTIFTQPRLRVRSHKIFPLGESSLVWIHLHHYHVDASLWEET